MALNANPLTDVVNGFRVVDYLKEIHYFLIYLSIAIIEHKFL